jgi:hypothetical protein
MTLRNAAQALRFQTAGAQGNVLRRAYVKNTRLGINGRSNQLDFYIADNIFEGRLSWPLTCADDGCAHGSDDGIRMEGFGHVIAHNRISGYGDAMKIEQTGARSVDFYGNEVLWSYDNGIELDDSEGNSRALRNRISNTHSPLSVQPVNGGPAYILRNITVNNAYGPLKFHAVGGGATPNGIFVYNNTFVSPYETLTMQAGVASHYFEIKNNLFVGPAVLSRGVTVDWFGLIDHGTFDYNGYWPNAYFCYLLPTMYVKAPNFAALQTYGIETHGTLLGSSIFASGLIGPSSHYALVQPQDVTLASGSSALAAPCCPISRTGTRVRPLTSVLSRAAVRNRSMVRARSGLTKRTSRSDARRTLRRPLLPPQLPRWVFRPRSLTAPWTRTLLCQPRLRAAGEQ